MPINDNEEAIEGNHDENKEGLMFAPEENIVSDDETFIEINWMLYVMWVL